MKLYRFLTIIVLVVLVSGTVFGGEYAADFLRIGVGARPVAMGGAFVALANDATSFYWNPAGLSQVAGPTLHFDHVPMFGGLAQYNSVNASMVIGKNMAVGLSWIRLGVDEIPRYGALQGDAFLRLTKGQYRSTGEPIGFFTDNEDAVLMSLSRRESFDLLVGPGFSKIRLPLELSYGVTGKYIHHKLDKKAGTGQGLDAGMLVKIVSDRKSRGQANTWMGFGILARDLSRTSIMWNTSSRHRDRVDTGFQAGVAFSKYDPGFHTRLTFAVDKEFGAYNDLHFGAEAHFFHTLAVRGGYYNGNFTAGTGLSLLGLSIDYAFVTNELTNTHRVSGSFRFQLR